MADSDEKMLFPQRKKFPLGVMIRRSDLLRYFCMKHCVFNRNPEMIERCLSSSSIFCNKN